MTDHPASERLTLGVILRESPGVTRWVATAWRAVAVVPGTGPGNWTALRREGATVDWHAASVELELHRAETEAYLVSLNASPPRLWVILKNTGRGRRPEVMAVTASAYLAQDHTDNGEDIVEPVAIPDSVAAWIADFCARHHREEPFVKRKRRPHEMPVEDGIGDARVRQAADVYRAPASIRKARG